MSITEKGVQVLDHAQVDTKYDESADVYIDLAVQRRAMRRFDLYVLPQIMIISILGYMDRSNLGESPMLQSFTLEWN
jgi:hypothetical protein